MKGIFHISEASVLAIHSMVMIGLHRSTLLTTKQMAKLTSSSEAHLAKVMQRLSRTGLVLSTRGPKGGFKLARPAETITLLDIYEAIEGPLLSESCLMKNGKCPFRTCIFGGVSETMGKIFMDYFSTKTVAHLLKEEGMVNELQQGDPQNS
ncbi:MAG: Rrf2 family transcriptional regulator [Candidatus Atribacteria bacterium]|nr:Rrf2 family transcriptional regulator [Candidatus Atribacteria bacterium]